MSQERQTLTSRLAQLRQVLLRVTRACELNFSNTTLRKLQALIVRAIRETQDAIECMNQQLTLLRQILTLQRRLASNRNSCSNGKCNSNNNGSIFSNGSCKNGNCGNNGISFSNGKNFDFLGFKNGLFSTKTQ